MKEKPKKIRIAQVIGRLDAAGIENVVFNFYRQIDKERFEFDFYYNADSSVQPNAEILSYGAHFYEIPPYKRIFSYMYVLWKAFGSRNYNIVHVHTGTLGGFALLPAWLRGVPTRIIHNHSIPAVGETYRNIAKYLLRMICCIHATHRMACSTDAAKWMFGEKAIQQGKAVLTRNALSAERFTFNAKCREKTRRELNICDNFVIGHVGRFENVKNHSFLLDVFLELQKRIPDSRLLLVGDGSLKGQIMKKASENGILEKCVFTGSVFDTAKFYQAMDCLLLPSFAESLGLAAIEAQTAGLPVINSEYVSNEALFMPNATRMKLTDGAARWAEYIAENFDIWKNQDRSEGYRRAKESGFDIQKETEKLEKYYERCAGRK